MLEPVYPLLVFEIGSFNSEQICKSGRQWPLNSEQLKDKPIRKVWKKSENYGLVF